MMCNTVSSVLLICKLLHLTCYVSIKEKIQNSKLQFGCHPSSENVCLGIAINRLTLRTDNSAKIKQLHVQSLSLFFFVFFGEK